MSDELKKPAFLISLHRDLGELSDSHIEWGEKRGKKKGALRWGIFVLTYAATEAFFREALDPERKYRSLPMNADKLRQAGEERGVQLFTSDWALRTRVNGVNPSRGNRSQWIVFEGTEQVRKYLADMKSLRDLLSHGADPFSMTNESGAMWVQKKGNSMPLMGAEGFLQACTDLAAQTILAFGGSAEQMPNWPEPRRSGISAEKKQDIKLLTADVEG